MLYKKCRNAGLVSQKSISSMEMRVCFSSAVTEVICVHAGESHWQNSTYKPSDTHWTETRFYILQLWEKTWQNIWKDRQKQKEEKQIRHLSVSKRAQTYRLRELVRRLPKRLPQETSVHTDTFSLDKTTQRASLHKLQHLFQTFWSFLCMFSARWTPWWHIINALEGIGFC